jgi:steroid delta-isomerase-like uncharacterized protein
MADNISLIRSLYDAWNARDFEQGAEAMAPDGKITLAGTGDVFEGPDGSRAYSASWANGFPDGQVTVDNIFGDGDRVVVEFTGRGTHTGTLETSMGSIPATGRSMTIKLCDVVQLENGKIVAQTSYFDTGSMMAQLGLMPAQIGTEQQ